MREEFTEMTAARKSPPQHRAAAALRQTGGLVPVPTPTRLVGRGEDEGSVTREQCGGGGGTEPSPALRSGGGSKRDEATCPREAECLGMGDICLDGWERCPDMMTQEEVKRGTGAREVEKEVWGDQLRRARERARSIVGYKSQSHRRNCI